MFRKVIRAITPNPLDMMLKKNSDAKNILLAWNRGLGDIALGLYAIIYRIKKRIPDANITFITRENLISGFSLLEDIEVIVANKWKRYHQYDVKETLKSLGVDVNKYDLIIEQPDPTYWVKWQHKTLVPRLKWDNQYDTLSQSFGLDDKNIYVGIQPSSETNYGLWRNWPKDRWDNLFCLLSKNKNVKIILLGYEKITSFLHDNVIDLRGKTNLFELLSIIKNKCHALVLPDSGVLSMAYYLDVNYKIKVISLWAEKNHGILKQGVDSPNRLLLHVPLVSNKKDITQILAKDVMRELNNIIN
jgi:ADP-heptose:LPS heptosyltransferase